MSAQEKLEARIEAEMKEINDMKAAMIMQKKSLDDREKELQEKTARQNRKTHLSFSFLAQWLDECFEVADKPPVEESKDKPEPFKLSKEQEAAFHAKITAAGLTRETALT